MSTETETKTATKAATDTAADASADAAADTSAEAEGAAAVEPDTDLVEDEVPEADLVPQDKPHGVGQGAAAVVAAGLGVVSLTGSWVGTVAAARSNLVGQLQTAQTAGVADQIQALYGNQWHLTALIGGAFALLAVVVGGAVLARPAFGAPGPAQAPWIKSVAWAGIGLGVIGLLLAVAKYTDLILGLPSAS